MIIDTLSDYYQIIDLDPKIGSDKLIRLGLDPETG